jgi:hypothetical protein
MSATTRTRTAALALGAALGLAALAGCADDGNADPTSAGSPTRGTDSGSTETAGPTDGDPTSEPAEPSSSATQTPTGSPEQVTVPVYFVGDTPQGPRLFREFRKVPGADPLTAAVDLMSSGEALDPDYGTLYPGPAFDSVEFDGTHFSARLTDGRLAPGGQLTRAEARLAVQQLVYTVQGVQQERAPVTVYVGDQPSKLFGMDTAAGLRNAPPLEVLGLVNVTAPEQSGVVSGTFTASGVASSFEATVPWELRRGGADGPVVKKGFATAEGWMDKLYPWQTDPIDVSGLAPGDYAFVAMTDDPSDGEGAGPTEDSKAVTVG